MKKHAAEWWVKRVEELADGVDADTIFRRYDVKKRTLLGWRPSLRATPRATPHATTRRAPRLLPVEVRAAPFNAVVSRDSALELVVDVGTLRLTLRGEVTAEHLAAIVSASARAC